MADPRWDEIEAIVLANKDDLKAAETTDALREIAKQEGIDLDDNSDFGKFTHKLKVIGVRFFDMLKEEGESRQAKKDEAIQEVEEENRDAPELSLWTAAIEDAESKSGSYAVVDATGEALWAGTFRDDDYVRVQGDDASAEQSVAEKAVFLARKVQEAAKLDGLKLVVYTQYPDLDITAIKRRGLAGGSKVTVTVTVDPDDDKALFMAQDNVDRNWKTVDLTELIQAD